jgi:hypothetical protein
MQINLKINDECEEKIKSKEGIKLIDKINYYFMKNKE